MTRIRSLQRQHLMKRIKEERRRAVLSRRDHFMPAGPRVTSEFHRVWNTLRRPSPLRNRVSLYTRYPSFTLTQDMFKRLPLWTRIQAFFHRLRGRLFHGKG